MSRSPNLEIDVIDDPESLTLFGHLGSNRLVSLFC